jgi:hypothetical protein
MVFADLRRLRPVLGGIKQFVVGYSSVGENVGGNSHARYCYSVWLRHLMAWRAAGMAGPIRVAAELGPGDSLGTGIAALLCGVDHYYGLDVLSYSNTSPDLVRALADLYCRRADLPGEDEFPELRPRIESSGFPHHLFEADDLTASLSPARVLNIVRAVENTGTVQGGVSLQYHVPWQDDSVIQPGTVDVAFSQAVMEHVEDVPGTYRALASWLKPNGYMSHQIDFRSHGLATDWNGHWAYSDWMFHLAKGRRPYLLNRQPSSTHVIAAREAGFEILGEEPVRQTGGIRRDDLAARFRGMSVEDLSTAGLFLLARKRATAES